MFVMPLNQMKLRTKELESSYAASYGRVRNWSATAHHHTKFHQGWDLEARTGTPCRAIAEGVITHVGTHRQFGTNIVLEFSKSGSTGASAGDALWAVYPHPSRTLLPPPLISHPSPLHPLTH